ncbi:MAG: hypothetical protein HY906_12820 [Deltaproteobacteria bacterium]|nr:hypothetical protein [Deltaproteobacteria bacterium]
MAGRALPLVLLAVGVLLAAWGLHAALRAARPRSWLGCLLCPVGLLLVAGGLYLALSP